MQPPPTPKPSTERNAQEELLAECEALRRERSALQSQLVVFQEHLHEQIERERDELRGQFEVIQELERSAARAERETLEAQLKTLRERVDAAQVELAETAREGSESTESLESERSQRMSLETLLDVFENERIELVQQVVSAANRIEAAETETAAMRARLDEVTRARDEALSRLDPLAPVRSEPPPPEVVFESLPPTVAKSDGDAVVAVLEAERDEARAALERERGERASAVESAQSRYATVVRERDASVEALGDLRARLSATAEEHGRLRAQLDEAQREVASARDALLREQVASDVALGSANDKAAAAEGGRLGAVGLRAAARVIATMFGRHVALGTRVAWRGEAARLRHAWGAVDAPSARGAKLADELKNAGICDMCALVADGDRWDLRFELSVVEGDTDEMRAALARAVCELFALSLARSDDAAMGVLAMSMDDVGVTATVGSAV